MGMYTEIYVNVDLKEDTPDEVINVIRDVCEGRTSEGKPDRWCQLGYSMSYYTPNTSCSNLTLDKISGRYSLLLKGDIKNYEGEIEQFFDFIEPHVDDEEFMGYLRYEEDREPTLIYKGETK